MHDVLPVAIEHIGKSLDHLTSEAQSHAPEWWKEWLKTEDDKELDKKDF